MINFILYEKNNGIREIYKKIILSFMGSKLSNYRILEIDNLNRNELLNIKGNKVYILGFSIFDKNAINVIKSIRYSGDYNSPIIVLFDALKISIEKSSNKLLILDLILKDEDLFINLGNAFKIAYFIVSNNKSLTYCKNKDLYNIPYNDILYIEKNINNNDSFIVTKDNDYLINDTISNLEKKLDDPRFFKTHRSCIINLFNVRNIDFNEGIIFFNNHQVGLLSRDKKKMLKEQLLGGEK